MPIQTHEIQATVMAVLSRSTIKVILLPGLGLADGGIPVDVPIDLVPAGLRLPNTHLTITMRGAEIVAVRSRDARK